MKWSLDKVARQDGKWGGRSEICKEGQWQEGEMSNKGTGKGGKAKNEEYKKTKNEDDEGKDEEKKMDEETKWEKEAGGLGLRCV